MGFVGCPMEICDEITEKNECSFVCVRSNAPFSASLCLAWQRWMVPELDDHLTGLLFNPFFKDENGIDDWKRLNQFNRW